MLAKMATKPITVFSNIAKQINAKCQADLYRIVLPDRFPTTMFVGVNIVNEGRKSIVGMCASRTTTISQYYSKVMYHELHKDMIKTESKEAQERVVTEERTQILSDFIKEALSTFKQSTKGTLPEQIIIYRDGLGGPSMATKVEEYEVSRILAAIKGFAENYTPKMLYVLVERRISHRLFHQEN